MEGWRGNEAKGYAGALPQTPQKDFALLNPSRGGFILKRQVVLSIYVENPTECPRITLKIPKTI
jgi:hypothetical protein